MLLVCGGNCFVLISQMRSNYLTLHPSLTAEQEPIILKLHQLSAHLEGEEVCVSLLSLLPLRLGPG